MMSKKGFSPSATNTEGEKRICLDGFESLSITDFTTDNARGQGIRSLLPIKRKTPIFVGIVIQRKSARRCRDGKK